MEAGAMMATSCRDCPYNKGVRGEEIICSLDYDPRECILWGDDE